MKKRTCDKYPNCKLGCKDCFQYEKKNDTVDFGFCFCIDSPNYKQEVYDYSCCLFCCCGEGA